MTIQQYNGGNPVNYKCRKVSLKIQQYNGGNPFIWLKTINKIIM